MLLSSKTLVALLNELGDWLEFEGAGKVEWLVCGGVAMVLQDLNQRTTRDVDMLGEWNQILLEVTCIDAFSPQIIAGIDRVVKNHPELEGFGAQWVNLGPSQLAKCGLPDGYQRRVKRMKFGKALALHLLDRIDLIPLKLYAAADRFSARQEIHFADLRLLNGSFEELDRALDWVRTVRDFEEKRPEIQAVLERLGYHDLAGYF